jgi:BirA family biotin operon repressor/biotin-[acetyl-CoA-carboxylase] ligase
MLDAGTRQIQQALSTWLSGLVVECVHEIDSTNTELMRRARAGRQTPTLLVAQRQTAGRGRMGRVWHGKLGDALTFSLGLPLAPRDWSGLSLAVGLSLAQSLDPQVKIKWPNDLWWQQRKLAGILVEACTQGAQSYAVIGVGINMAVPARADLRTPAAGLCEILPGLEADHALLRVAMALVPALLRFQQQGFRPLQAAFMSRDALAGQAVTLSDGRIGTASGVDERGALLVHTDQGVQAVSSLEISVRPQSRLAGGAATPIN